MKNKDFKLMKFTIYGQLYSKANSRIITRGRNIKSKNALNYEKFALQQLFFLKHKNNWETITEEVILMVIIYYPSNRQDLDESLLMDVLQKARIIKNDRQIKEKHIYHAIDKKNPRCEITLIHRT